jgi:hypothetical protein
VVESVTTRSTQTGRFANVALAAAAICRLVGPNRAVTHRSMVWGVVLGVPVTDNAGSALTAMAGAGATGDGGRGEAAAAGGLVFGPVVAVALVNDRA